MTSMPISEVKPEPITAPQGRAERPPGPGQAELLTLGMRYANTPFELLPAIARHHGDVVDLPVPGMTVTLLSHPDHVEHIMTRHHQRYGKSAVVHELVMDEPPALPLLEYVEWKRTRRPLNPFFGEQALARTAPAMVAATTRQVDSWAVHAQAGDWVDLEHELGAVVLAGLMSSMFNADLDDDALDRYAAATEDYGRAVVRRMLTRPVPGWLPLPGGRRGRAAQAYILGELDGQIARRLAQPPREQADILDVLLGMTFDGTPQMQYARLRSELNGLVFAGYDTTADALAWTIALLCHNPSALGTAYEEVDALDGAPLEYAHLEQLTYLRDCFDEAQRIQSQPINVRTALEDDEIGGYHIPRGSHVVISPYGLQNDPRFWNAPEKFEPSRFRTDPINRNAFIPFNTGPRKCMGSRMAYISGVLILASILQRYTFQARDGWTPKHQLKVSTGLAGGLPVRLRQR